MKTNRLNFSVLYLSLVFIFLFTHCEKEKISDESTGFKFPAIDYVYPQVYGEMKKTCAAWWDLSQMTDSTLVILTYTDGYEIHCNGQSEGLDYAFVITTDPQGKWVSDNRQITTTQRKTYFDPAKIDQLKLANMKYFWYDGFSLDTMSYHIFKYDLGFQGALRLENKKHQIIEVSVFQAKKDAVRAMEYRRNNVAAIFRMGPQSIIKGNWWYVIDWPGVVIANQMNTLLEVEIYTNSETVKDSLYYTAKEIARRIEVLSE